MSKQTSIQKILLDKLISNDDLMYREPEHIIAYTSYMSDLITEYASTFKPYTNVYDKGFTISKSELRCDDWLCDSFDYSVAYTGGGTTGNRFRYRRWNDVYNTIEGDMHYKQVLKEFGIIENPSILVLFLDELTKYDWIVNKMDADNHLIYRHGAHNASVWYTKRDKLYNRSVSDYFSRLFDFISKNDFDILLTGGHSIVSLCHYITELKFTGRIANLLSNTYEPMPRHDVDRMVDNGHVSFWCDHMRCWDGGCTFLTCKFGRYHLLDNLSYIVSMDGRMICTDYFSICSPFVKYWNGDYCEIDNTYAKCQCGRYYRPFKMNKSRGLSLGNCDSDGIVNAIHSINLRCIKSLKVSRGIVEIVSGRPLSETETNCISLAAGGREIRTIIQQ